MVLFRVQRRAQSPKAMQQQFHGVNQLQSHGLCDTCKQARYMYIHMHLVSLRPTLDESSQQRIQTLVQHGCILD